MAPFLISFLSFVHFNVIGDLYLTELMLAFYLLFTIGRWKLLSVGIARKILILGGLWLVSQIITDIVRGTPVDNYLRGWAAIAFFLIDFCSLYLMIKSKQGALRMLVLGSALGTIVSVVFFPTNYSAFEPWKFGYGFPVTLLLLLYISEKRRYLASPWIVLLALLGVLGVLLNARSLGAMTILTALTLYFWRSPRFNSYERTRHSLGKKIFLAAGVFVGILGIVNVYKWAAESGYLPEKVTEKYRMGKIKNSGMLGLIAGGRPEILISSRAVADSPFIGHGSWAEDPYYANMRFEAVAKLGLNIDDAFIQESIDSTSLIPTHSVLMQAWVWAGLLGAVFWVFILAFLFRSTLSAMTRAAANQPLVIFLGISSMWNLLFSPFGAHERFSWAIAICVLYFSIGVATNKVKQPIAPGRLKCK